MPFLLWILIPFASAQTCDSRSTPVAQLRRQLCAAEFKANGCDQWFKQNPDSAAFAKNCEGDDVGEPLYATCLKAIGSAWIQIYKDIGEHIAASDKYYADCESDPALTCKRELAKESYFNYKNEDELREVFTGDLVRKRDQVRTLAARDPQYRASLIKAGVPLPELGNGIGEVPYGLIQSAAKSQLNELGVKYQCYNTQGFTNMACYALGNLTDPTMWVTGAVAVNVLRGGKWAAAALKTLRRSEKVAEAGWVPFFTPKAARTDVIARASSNASGASRRLLGEGGTGKVFAVAKMEPEGPRVVANKLVFTDASQTAAEHAADLRSMAEVEKKGGLDGFHVAEVYGVKGRTIELEYAEGRSLNDVINDPALANDPRTKQLLERYNNSVRETGEKLKNLGYNAHVEGDGTRPLSVTVNDGKGPITTQLLDDGEAAIDWGIDSYNTIVESATGRLVLVDPH